MTSYRQIGNSSSLTLCDVIRARKGIRMKELRFHRTEVTRFKPWSTQKRSVVPTGSRACVRECVYYRQIENSSSVTLCDVIRARKGSNVKVLKFHRTEVTRFGHAMVNTETVYGAMRSHSCVSE